MDTALGYIYDIFDSFINCIFNTLSIGNGVTIGWILISCFVFSFVISNLLSIPSVGSLRTKEKERHN